MIVKKLTLGPLGANTYIVFDEKSKEAAIIDATGDPEVIIRELKNLGANLKYILLTHGHFDHVFCVNEIKKLCPDAKALIHKDDLILSDNISVQCANFGINGVEKPTPDGYVDENSELNLGDTKIKVIHTPGHSKGSVCYLAQDELFSGDTVFYEEIGRCDLFGGSFEEIEKSIREKIFTLDKNITVHPGHGDDSTIGHEVKYNAYFGENSRY